MYSHTISKQASDDIIQSSTSHQPVSPFLRRSNHALLDKRPSKKQRNALYVNSRHVASHHPTLKAVQPATQNINQAPQPDESLNEDQLQLKLETNDVEISLEARSSPGLQVPEDIMDVDAQSTDSSAYETISTTSVSSKANVSTESNEDTFTQSFNTMVSIDSKAPMLAIKDSSPPQTTIYPDHGATATSHNQALEGPMNIKHVAQTRSMPQVKSWKAILKYIHKQLQNHELFGDELVFTRENPDFLTLLKQIDQWKNWVTYQEEQATSLSLNIKDILVNNARVIDRESKKLAVQIVDNFDQRFRNQRYFGPRG